MERTSYISMRWEWCLLYTDLIFFHFIAELLFYKTSILSVTYNVLSLKESAGRHVAPLWCIIQIPCSTSRFLADQILLLLHNVACLCLLHLGGAKATDDSPPPCSVLCHTFQILPSITLYLNLSSKYFLVFLFPTFPEGSTIEAGNTKLICFSFNHLLKVQESGCVLWVRVMVFNATFNNISVISW